MRRVERTVLSVGMLLLTAAATSAEPLPARLAGTWRIVRVLPTSNTACWGNREATPLVGSTLTYAPRAMKWRGGQVRLAGISTRTLTDEQFRKENAGQEGTATFAQLGIRSRSVLEVDMQHEDMDITGATTEVPGDSVLLAGPNRIVVSACGVYFEATRAAAVATTSLKR